MFEKSLFVAIIGGLATLAVVLSVKYLLMLFSTVGILQVIFTCASVSITGWFIDCVIEIIKQIANKL